MPLFDRVRRGERLRIRADQWNAIVDLADQAQRNQTQFGDADQLAPVRAPNVVLIKNDTNQPVPRFGVLQISGALHDPTNRADLENEFVTKLALRGTRPDGTSPAIVVALEPIPAGSIGQAAASGVFACKVDVCSSAHRFAVAKGSDIATLQSAPEGPVQILWTANRGRASWTIAAM